MPEGGKGTLRSVASDQTGTPRDAEMSGGGWPNGQGQAPVGMGSGDRGVDIGYVSDFDIGTEGENRMSLLCQTQMQSRL